MKTKIFILFFFCISRVMAIDFDAPIYSDPTTCVALKYFSNTLKSKQEATIKAQSKLAKAQGLVMAQLTMVDNLQKKVYKGLREVSGTLQNAMQVKSIYANIKDCHRYSTQIKDLVKQKPMYAVFGAKATQKSYEQLLKIGSEVSTLLTASDTNLATAGDRYKMLARLENEVRKLKLWLITVTLHLERAIRIGFWRSINPFQGYINTDKDIVENIMYKFNHL